MTVRESYNFGVDTKAKQLYTETTNQGETMVEKRFSISFENNGCSRCLFLNSSDTGEDCKILKSEICEDEWSNIDYQFKKNWRYKGCPLIHHENLNEHKGIIAIKGDMSIEDSLNLLEENEQLKEENTELKNDNKRMVKFIMSKGFSLKDYLEWLKEEVWDI